MIHSASPKSRLAVIAAWFWSFGTDGLTDGTLCVKIVITTGWDCGRPRGSICNKALIYFLVLMTHQASSDKWSLFPLMRSVTKTKKNPHATSVRGAWWVTRKSLTFYIFFRAVLSKIIEPEELGAGFACLAFTQAIVTLVSPTANLIYSATLDWHKGFIMCLSALFLLICAILTIPVHFIVKKAHYIDKTYVSDTKIWGINALTSLTNLVIHHAPCSVIARFCFVFGSILAFLRCFVFGADGQTDGHHVWN